MNELPRRIGNYKSIKSRLFTMAWNLKKDYERNQFNTMSFAEALKIAWKMIKKWSGEINDRVEVLFEKEKLNLVGFNRPVTIKFTHIFN